MRKPTNYITVIQQKEIEELANAGHSGAIIAAMRDSYHQGIYDGRIKCLRDIGIGIVIGYCVLRTISKKQKEFENH